MNQLIDFIKEKLNIAYFEENEAVLDGSFTVSPYLTSGLAGNGINQTVVNYYAVDIFFVSKIEALASGQTIWSELLKNKYFCDDPQYTFEQNGGFWRITLRVKQLMEV